MSINFDRVSFWKTCIREALQSLGGEADLQDIYR